MQLENTSVRLKKLMEERNLRQVDLLELVKPFCEKYNIKMNKSDISQYLSGAVKPGQEKLSMLGMALNINEAWLMGFDVPKEKPHYIKGLELTKDEKNLLHSFNKLNDLGKKEAHKRVSELAEISKYINTKEEHDESIENDDKYITIAAHADGIDPDVARERLEQAKKAFRQIDEE